MKLFRYLCVAGFFAAICSASVWAADETRTYQLKNRLRLEYDDNVYERDKDTEESWKIIEEVELLVNFHMEQTFVGLRYRPSFVWWDNRDPDDTDFHNDFDLVFAQNFSPRLTLNIKDTFRAAELPEEIDRGATIRDQDDFIYNVADASLNYVVRPGTRLDVGGRYTLLRYEENDVSDAEDYDIYAGGLTLRHQVGVDTTVLGEYRLENIDYEGPDRGSDSQYVGAGFEEVFSPNLLANLRGGAQFKTYNDSDIDDDSAPYVDGSLTYLPSPRTRITGGLGYSLFEADVTTYANQDRLVAYLSMAYDITARISLYLAGSHQLSEYKEDESIDPTAVLAIDDDGSTITPASAGDADENTSQFSARASYKVNRRNWLEVGWQYLTLDSDLREDFDRNRLEVGWRTEL